jgi:hypothetical protein
MTKSINPRIRYRELAQKAADALVAFYSRPIAWIACLATSLTMAYAGGAAMFWVHAIQRGEAGPAISDVAHWFLDSTLGFVGLTPAVFVLLPAAMAVTKRLAARSVRARLAAFVTVTGIGFAVLTVPGPAAHGIIAGQNTPLAQAAEQVFGDDPTIAARNARAADHSAVSEGLVQLLVGVPVYLMCAGLALVAVRTGVKVARRLASRTTEERVAFGN